MSNHQHLYISSTGILTPLGDSSDLLCAAVRSGISSYQDTHYFNRRDYPIKGCTIPAVALPEPVDELLQPGISTRTRRISRLAAPALQGALSDSEVENAVPLFLVGPECLSGPCKDINGSVIKQVVAQAGVELDLKRTRYFASGRGGVLEALDLAFKFFDRFDDDFVLVGGVDSYFDPALLSTLDSESRILAENSSSGFAASEGACFFMLTPKAELAENSVRVCRPGLAYEPGHFYSDTPNNGTALSSAMTSAIDNANAHSIGHIYSTMNGESYFSKEYGVAMIRNQKFFTSNANHYHPADCYGDLGAASSAVLLKLAADDIVRNTIDGSALVYASSDLGCRAAVCLSSS